MARVHARRKTLADMIDVTDLDGAVDDLLRMSEQEFTRAVLLYLEGDRLGMDVMRDPYVIERTFDTIDRLLRGARRRWRDGENTKELSALIESLDTERKAIRDEAVKARQDRIREQQGERDAEYAERVAARLERAAARQRAMREELERVQSKTPRALATQELIKTHEPEYLALVRKYKRQAEEAGTGERARVDGGGAADPPLGSTAPLVPTQAAWV